jgi:hypothetical protein
MKGELIPNWVVQDHEGKSHSLWDFRQKSHVALLYDPASGEETVKRWLGAIAADQKQWDWLNVKFIVVSSAPKEMAPGIYAIDRYGTFLNAFPTSHWNFDTLEREFLYYEACHC